MLLGPYRFPAVAGASDPFYTSVVLLTHYNEANNSIVFTDNSSVPKTPTRLGTPVISTAQSKFGGSSLLLATNQGLSYASEAAWDFGVGDLTIEAWIKVTANQLAVIVGRQQASASSAFQFRLNAGKVELVLRNAAGGGLVIISSTLNHSITAWQHVAVTRAANLVKIFIDGVGTAGVSTTTNANPSVARPFTVGVVDDTTLSSYFNGHIDDLRVTKGVARYTANFTPPILQHPDS